MFQVVILPLARDDIREAAKWYNSKLMGLGVRFTKEIREKVKFISGNPYACAIRHGFTRTAVLRSFPFLIHYSIDNKKKLIIISAVLHTSRNPKSWKKR